MSARTNKCRVMRSEREDGEVYEVRDGEHQLLFESGDDLAAHCIADLINLVDRLKTRVDSLEMDREAEHLCQRPELER